MKTKQIVRSGFLGQEFIGIVGLVSVIWWSSTSSSFGTVTITRVPPGNSVVCGGSVDVQGTVSCNRVCEEAKPVVKVVNSLCPGSIDWPTVDASCSGDLWSGTWGPTSISLAKGVNVITASDDCYGSASISVTSNGGSGASFQITVERVCTEPTYCGARLPFQFCCLTQGHQYTCTETVTGTCSTGSPCTPSQPNYPLTAPWQQGADPCKSFNDSATWVCPSQIPAGFSATCHCVQTWTLTDVTDGVVVASGTTTRDFTVASSPIKKLTVAISGDASGTVSCP
jgi:hypothetical protein